jgi:hypothetical protein
MGTYFKHSSALLTDNRHGMIHFVKAITPARESAGVSFGSHHIYACYASMPMAVSAAIQDGGWSSHPLITLLPTQKDVWQGRSARARLYMPVSRPVWKLSATAKPNATGASATACIRDNDTGSTTMTVMTWYL